MIKRTMHIEIDMKEGESIKLDGDAAQKALSQLNSWKLGTTTARAFSYTDAETGKIVTTGFHCICGYTMLPQTETEVPDEPCKQIDCL